MAVCGVTKSTTMCDTIEKYFVKTQRIPNRSRMPVWALHNAELTWLAVTGYMIRQDMVVTILPMHFLKKLNHNLLLCHVSFQFSTTTSLICESVVILLDPLKNQMHNLWTSVRVPWPLSQLRKQLTVILLIVFQKMNTDSLRSCRRVEVFGCSLTSLIFCSKDRPSRDDLSS